MIVEHHDAFELSRSGELVLLHGASGEGDARARVGQAVKEDGGCVAGKDRTGCGAERHHGQLGDEHFRRVGREHRDRVAALDAERLEAGGELAAADVDLSPFQVGPFAGGGAEADGGAGRVDGGARREEVGDAVEGDGREGRAGLDVRGHGRTLRGRAGRASQAEEKGNENEKEKEKEKEKENVLVFVLLLLLLLLFLSLSFQ